MDENKSDMTRWCEENDMTNVQFYCPNILVREMAVLKQVTGTKRPEMIKSAIRAYLRTERESLGVLEKAEYHQLLEENL